LNRLGDAGKNERQAGDAKTHILDHCNDPFVV
jgi:hypothetical protein